VINKVLRDLDQRQAAASSQNSSISMNRDQVVHGTRALEQPASKTTTHVLLLAIGVAALLLACLAIWWWLPQRSAPPIDPSLNPPIPAAVAVAPAPIAVPTSASTPVAATAPVSAPALANAPVVLPALPASIEPAPTPTPRPVAALVKSHTLPGQPAAPAVKSVASEANPSAPVAALVGQSVTPVAVPAKPAVDSLQHGGNQALAQAQAMWNEGARASAIDLLRQTLSRIELAGSGSSGAATPALLLAVARELARMEMAEGQVSAALKLLVRLEPQINQVADMWAMRGNAAQRLGQHPDAANSYRRALKLKPDEPRWLLGLGVSLAIQGQTAEAAELAERARVLGGLRPEIANYLRQLGVSIHAE
jgi:hypothetical protein